MELGQLFLRVMRHVDALEGRFASAMSFSSVAGADAMAQIENRMASLEAELSTSSARTLLAPLTEASRWRYGTAIVQIADSTRLPVRADSLARRADAVAAAAEVRAAAAAAPSIPELSSKLDPSSLEAVFSILKQQNEAVRALEVSFAAHDVCTLRTCRSFWSSHDSPACTRM